MLNDELVRAGMAKPIDKREKTSFSIFYPPFGHLEKLRYYPNYNTRTVYAEKNVDFNDFEENFINPCAPFEAELDRLFEDEYFVNIRTIFNNLNT